MDKRTLMVIAFSFVAAFRAIAGEPIVLDNGATLLLEPIPGTGAIAVIALYDTGFADDLPGVAQSTHLVEHLRVTAGTETTAPGQTQAELNRLGAANAETLGTITYYDYAVPAGSLEIALRAEADRLTALRITDADIAREIPRVRAEVTQLVSAPGIMLGKFAAMAGAQLWLHEPDAGTIDIHISDAPTPEAMLSFAHAHHNVSDLTLLITGDIDPVAATEQIRDIIGSIGAPEDIPAEPSPDFGTLAPHRRVTWDLPATVVLVALPGDMNGTRAEMEAIAARAMFRLNQHEIIRSAFASGNTIPSGPMPLFVGVCVRAEDDIDKVIAVIHEALDTAAVTEPGQARETARYMNGPIQMPTSGTIAAMVERTVTMRRLPPGRAHTVAAQMMGNAALQNHMRSGSRSESALSDQELAEMIKAVFSPENRRILVISPE